MMKLKLIAIALLLTMGILLPLGGCGQTDLPPQSNDSTTDSAGSDTSSTDTSAPEPCDVCSYDMSEEPAPGPGPDEPTPPASGDDQAPGTDIGGGVVMPPLDL